MLMLVTALGTTAWQSVATFRPVVTLLLRRRYLLLGLLSRSSKLLFKSEMGSFKREMRRFWKKTQKTHS
jgi:hypothetical protein